MRYHRLSSLAVSSICLALACSSEESSESEVQQQQPSQGGNDGASAGAPNAAPNDGAADEAGPGAPNPNAAGSSTDSALPTASADAGSAPGAFFVQQVVETDAGPVSYLAAVPGDSLDALGGIDASAIGLSVPGDSPATVHGSAVFVAGSAEPQISRFDLGADGRLVAGPSLSFGELGVLDVFPWRIIVASDTKAYLFDSENGRAIAWNPATMQLTGSEIDISAGVKPGFTLDPLASYGRTVNGTAFVPGSWYSDDEGASLGTAALYAIDVASDELLELSEDTRCAGYVLATLPSGDLHVLPDNLFAEELGLGTDASACSLRVPAGSVSFDPDFAQDLGALVAASGAAAGFVQGGISDGSGGIYLGVAAPPAGDAGAGGDALVYDLFRWDVALGTASPVPGSAFTGALLEQWNGAPPSFALQPAADLASTRVLALSVSPPTEVSVTGNVVAVAKLR